MLAHSTITKSEKTCWKHSDFIIVGIVFVAFLLVGYIFPEIIIEPMDELLSFVFGSAGGIVHSVHENILR